jgi:hypothetical protein
MKEYLVDMSPVDMERLLKDMSLESLDMELHAIPDISLKQSLDRAMELARLKVEEGQDGNIRKEEG